MSYIIYIYTYSYTHIHTDSGNENLDMCYYILIEGECIVVKDGKQVHNAHGRIHVKGSTFGENGLLKFGSRSASIVASPETAKTVLYCLDGKIFREFVGDDEITKLQEKISKIQTVLDTLSGADTKMRKGTIIKPYQPESVRVCWRSIFLIACRGNIVNPLTYMLILVASIYTTDMVMEAMDRYYITICLETSCCDDAIDSSDRICS